MRFTDARAGAFRHGDGAELNCHRVEPAYIQADRCATRFLQGCDQPLGQLARSSLIVRRSSVDRLRHDGTARVRPRCLLQLLDVAAGPCRHLVLERLVAVLHKLADGTFQSGLTRYRQSGRHQRSDRHWVHLVYPCMVRQGLIVVVLKHNHKRPK